MAQLFIAESKLNWTYSLELGEFCLAIYLVVKYIFWILLQIFYEQFKHNHEYQHITSKIQLWLGYTGSIYRSLGGLGLFCNMLFSAIIICFYFPNVFGSHPRRFKILHSSRPSDLDIQRAKVYQCLIRMIGSSEVYAKERAYSATGSLLLELVGQKSAHLAELDDCLSRLDVRANRPSISKFNKELFSFNHLRRSRCRSFLGFNSLSGTEFIPWNQVVDSMTAEQNKLLELVDYIDSLARKSMSPSKLDSSRLFVRLYIYFMVYFIVLVVAGQLLANETLPKTRTGIEYFTIVEQYSLVFFGLNNFIPTLTDIVAGFRSRMKYLAEVERRFRFYLAIIAHNQKVQRGKQSSIEMLVHSNEELELYLGLQMFANNISLLYEQSRSFIYRCIFCVLYSLLPALLYLDLNSTLHVSLLVGSITSVIIALNTTFFFCSFVSTSCLRVVNLAWPLIAISVQNQLDFTNNPVELNKQDARQHFMIISPHSLQLWRRLVEDKERLIDKYTCKVFGSMRLEYTSVIRVNVWILSLVILFLGSRLH